MPNTQSFTFSIPKNTPANFCKVGVFEVLSPKLKSISITIPSGHKGLAYLQISIPGYQLVPAVGSSDVFINGDGQTKEYDPDVIVSGPPYFVTAKGYNLDSFLEHSFSISFTVE